MGVRLSSRVVLGLLLTLSTVSTAASAQQPAAPRPTVLLPLTGATLPQKTYRALDDDIADSMQALTGYDVQDRMQTTGVLAGAKSVQCGEQGCPPCPPQAPVCWVPTLDTAPLVELGSLLTTDVVVAPLAQVHEAGIEVTLIAVDVTANKLIGKRVEVFPVDDGLRARVDRQLSQLLAPDTSQCTLDLKVDPENADVTVDGKTVPPTSKVTLEPGVYEVKIASEGLVAETHRVVLQRQQTVTLEVSLQPEPVNVMLFTGAAVGSIGAVLLGTGIGLVGASYAVALQPPTGPKDERLNTVTTMNTAALLATSAGALMTLGGFAAAGVSLVLETPAPE